MIPFTSLLTIDPSSKNEWNMQTLLLERFFENINQDAMQLISGEQATKHICAWPGLYTSAIQFVTLQCDGGVLTKMTFLNFQNGQMAFAYLPPRLEYVAITSSGQSGKLDLRCLPRCAQTINLSLNALMGTLDLAQLPENTKVFDVQGNEFHGTISLIGLPSGIVDINVQLNKLKVKRLYYDDDLPESLRKLRLIGVAVGEIVGVDGTNRRIEPSVVIGVVSTKIH